MSEKKLEVSDEVKAELLALAEKVSKESVESIFKLANFAIKASANKIDDLLLPALPFIKERLITLLDEISEDV